MFALILCGLSAVTQIGNDPVIAVQARYPVSRVVITTASGSNVQYALPQDAPNELKRAVRVLEIAERDVLITEALQLLKLEIVKNERKLEALRTNFNAAALQPAAGNGFGNSGDGSTSGRYYMSKPPQAPEPLLKQFLAANLAMEATTERALLALDRLADAEYKLHLTWIGLAYPDRKGLDARSRPQPGADPVNKVMVVSPPMPAAPAIPANLYANLTFDQACKLANDLALEDESAQKRVLAATAKVDEAALRHLTAEADGKAEAKRELDAATKAHQEVRAERELTRLRWKAASDRVLELTGPGPKR